MRGMPAIHSSASSTPRQASQQNVDPLVGAHQPEAQHDRLLGLKWSPPTRCGRDVGEVREDAVGDHVDPVRVQAQLVREARAAVLGVDDDRVEAVVQTPLRRELAPAGLAREHVVGGQHERPPAAGYGLPARQQMTVDVLDRQPLEVHDVRRAGGAAVGEHVGNVLGELHSTLRAGARREARGAVEQLAALVALGGAPRARRRSGS